MLPQESRWNFFTNHAHVLIYLQAHPDLPLRRVALAIGITERAVQRIIVELEADGYLKHIRDGRRNVYKIISRKSLRHTVEKHRQVYDLINLIKT